MKKLLIILSSGIVAFACQFALASEWTYEGRVTYIVDGDTFDMQGEDGLEHRIRPAGFDTPESGRPCYGEATRFLRQMIDEKVVKANCYKFQPETKKHKRRDICRVSLDGKDIGLEMIHTGMAWHAKAWAHEQRKDERRQYVEAEYKAMQDGKGCLWADDYASSKADMEPPVAIGTQQPTEPSVTMQTAQPTGQARVIEERFAPPALRVESPRSIAELPLLYAGFDRKPIPRGLDTINASEPMEGEVPPRHLPSNEAPRYPLAALAVRAQGRTLVRAEIRPDGTVGQLFIKQSSGFHALDLAALETVRGWRFVPAQRHRMAVAMWLDVPIEYKLP